MAEKEAESAQARLRHDLCLKIARDWTTDPPRIRRRPTRVFRGNGCLLRTQINEPFFVVIGTINPSPAAAADRSCHDDKKIRARSRERHASRLSPQPPSTFASTTAANPRKIHKKSCRIKKRKKDEEENRHIEG